MNFHVLTKKEKERLLETTVYNDMWVLFLNVGISNGERSQRTDKLKYFSKESVNNWQLSRLWEVEIKKFKENKM